MTQPTKDPAYINGVWRDVPMVDGMEVGSSPYANALYEANVVGAMKVREPLRSIALYQAKQAWDERAKARGLSCLMPTENLATSGAV